MRTTIKDIAREAGVSVSTVSYALAKLRREGKVTKDTHKRVCEAAARLNYIPDATARSLVQGRTNSIGVILPPISAMGLNDPYFMQVLATLSTILAKREYWVSLYLPEKVEENSMRIFLENSKIDGLIWLVQQIPQHFKRVLDSRRLPYITLEYGAGFAHPGSTILLDDYMGTWTAVDYLCSLGHRDLLFIGGDIPQDDHNHRKRAFIDRLKDEPDCRYWTITGNYTERGTKKALEEFLRREGLCFTGLVVASDVMAISALRVLSTHGISVPEEVSVIGFDDIPAAKDSLPPLTTVAQPIEEMMSLACDYLFRAMQDGEWEPFQRRVVPKLVLRETTRER